MANKLINQLEPDSLINNFLEHPPVNFESEVSADGTPLFTAKFDLLTTVESDVQQKIKKVPLYHWWGKLLRPIVTFVGTTVSEYALLSDRVDASTFARNIKVTYTKRHPFVIIKDIPYQSPLLSQQDNQYCEQAIDALKDNGFIEVEGQALAWLPIDYQDLDDYLSRFSSSRRKNFRRKLKHRQQLEIDQLNGGDDCFFLPEVLAQYYQLYLNVYQQSEIHFDLLSAEFFKRLLQDKHSNAKIFTYRHQGELIGYNICFVVDNVLIDKYIGLVYPQAHQFNLYFVSWFYNLEYAKQAGLDKYIAGWTDPQVKAQLGAQFTLTKHLVYVRNPLLRFVLKKMSKLFESDGQWFEQHNKQNDND